MIEIYPKFLIIYVFLIFAINAYENPDSNYYMRSEHSLIRPFQGTGVNFPNWEFEGHTIVTNHYIRLTPDEKSKSGAIWNQVPCNSINWEVHLVFKVHGKGTTLFGDGFAVWYAKEKYKSGKVFGSKDYFSGLAIIVDTYSNQNGPHNHQHPYISAMVNNGSLMYDHDRDGTHTQLAGCEAKFRGVDFDTSIRIRYFNDVLSVFTDLEKQNSWKPCFTVNGVLLPLGYYFGVSAETGDLSDNHDILAFKFYDLGDENATISDIEARKKILPQALSFEQPRERKEDPRPGMSTAKIFFILLFGMLVSVAIVIFTISYCKEKSLRSRKHFY